MKFDKEKSASLKNKVVDRDNRIAAGWGFAEATLFFIIPDVFITLIAIKDSKKGWRACFFALAGALAGGAIMYGWGARDPDGALGLLDILPAISEQMLKSVGESLSDQGLIAVLLGPTRGTPYKIYAVQAPGAGIGLAAFLSVSVPARLIRFLLAWGLARLFVFLSRQKLSDSQRMNILFLLWLLGYTLYFILMPG